MFRGCELWCVEGGGGRDICGYLDVYFRSYDEEFYDA